MIYVDEDFYEYLEEQDKRVYKAIEYIEQLPFSDLVPLEVKIIYGILKGSDTNE